MLYKLKDVQEYVTLIKYKVQNFITQCVLTSGVHIMHVLMYLD